MKTYLHVLALATCAAFITASPASESRDLEEGSGDGPEIVINDVVEKNIENNDADDAVESAVKPSDLLDLEVNPEENEIKVNEKIAEDGTNKLDKKKCQKCIRSHYRARHDEFCGSCEKQNGNGEVKEEETSQIQKPKRCIKCARKNFKARNEGFCSEQCSAEGETKPIKKVHNKKVHNKKNKDKTVVAEKEETAQTDESESESAADVADVKVTNNVDDVAETTTEQDTKNTEKKNNKTKKNKKNKNKEKKKHKNKKHATDKGEESLSQNDESPIEEQEDQKDAVKLGPLENLIKFLIKSNTYTH
eukprot:TRINITY_DN1476_c0_g1_i1.p1 TRINITY_DN1476_c0_g1~~TRINITY_DN1476_c0_g1_i1.p1  ORF type:complete len:305 (+),score=109.64 TRINITY_DN1476_c0_g1_i1:138-1052(+)